MILPLLLLLQVAVCNAQSGGKSLREKIDSLNNEAYDNPESVLQASNKLLKIVRHKKLAVEYGLLLQVKGVAETSLGNNSQALKNHIASYHIFDSVKNDKGKIFSLCNIATVHLNLENYGSAQNYLSRALAITPSGDYNNLSNIYVNLGVTHANSGKPKKAIGYYLKAIPYQQKRADYNALAVTNHNIGETYKDLGDLKNAEIFELQALEYQKKSGSASTLAMASLALAGIYIESGIPQKALPYLKMGEEAAMKLKSPYYEEMYYDEMARWNNSVGDHKEEAYYLNKLLMLRDTLHNYEKAEIDLALEKKFQTRLKTQEIELLKAQKKLSDAKIESSTLRWVILLAISVLCICIIVILYRNFRLKQKANLLLGKEKTELEEKNLLLEKENILVQFETLKNQVSPHFLFNSLNALAAQIKTDPDKALEFTSVFSKLFRNVLELKDRHLITLGEELQHVQSYFYLQQMRFGENMIITLSVPAAYLKKYIPPFALQMVAENAIKHNIITAEEPLNLSITTNDDWLIVKNNLRQRKHVEDSTGTGIQNIALRYKYLGEAEPVFEINNEYYIAKLPLISE